MGVLVRRLEAERDRMKRERDEEEKERVRSVTAEHFERDSRNLA